MQLIMNSLLLLLVFHGLVDYSQEWSFSDENPWPEKYCKKGIEQSPIDLVDGENTVNSNGPKLSFENLDKVQDATLVNDGHMVRIYLNSENVTVSGGRLPGMYQLDHIGFHWNSGHTLNGDRKALELTLFLCNNLFENCEEAERYADGVSLMSTLYEYQDEDNEIFDPVIKSLDDIMEANSSSKIKLNPRTLMPKSLKKFYRYWGSLTIPDCIEGKPWTIFEEFCKISQNQVDQLMKLKGENGEALKKTHRNTQNLNERTLLKMTTS